MSGPELWEPRPIPKPTPENQKFWDAAADGILLLSKCSRCDLVFYYPRAFCPDCFSEKVDWLEASGKGRVYTYSVLYRHDGWPQDDLPLVHAYIELEEGPRILNIIIGSDPDQVSIGVQVIVTFVPTDHGDVSIPVFRID